MIIKSITIENFRSYYGKNTIELCNGMNLIIGANGDGKTTLYEAIEWLFDTTGIYHKTDENYISKKRISELVEDQSDTVKVSMSYENNGNKTIEKSFRFTKSLNNEIKISNYSHIMYKSNGIERQIYQDSLCLKEFEQDFSFTIRKYSLFKGESDLNIFNKPEAMKYLLETFSEVRNFDPYLSFMEYSKDLAQTATDRAFKSDKRNAKQATELSNEIKREEEFIYNYNKELETKNSEAGNFAKLLEDIEKNKETSAVLVSTNARLHNLQQKRSECLLKIKENYSVRLLDDMWILLGFEPIAKEFTKKISSISLLRRKMENKFQKELGARAYAKQMQDELNKGFIPLSVHVPDEKTMREMLNDEVCKVCGRPAPKGSDAYNFMQRRLDDYLKSLHKEEEKEKNLFDNEYITEMEKLDTVLNNNLNQVTSLLNKIMDDMAFNDRLHDDVKKYDTNIEKEIDAKKRILAQTDGLNEEQLTSAYTNISEWWQLRSEAEKRAQYLSTEIEKHKVKLDELHEKYNNLSKDSNAEIYARTNTAIRKIFDAFKAAKIYNKQEFLSKLEGVANKYLQVLNMGDFTGTVRIIEKASDSAEIMLMDVDGKRIYNPNTALKTTMFMSLLFAVSKLTTIQKENDYPLIFDAPTSSFTGAKESDFFNVIGNINKQTIIVTKSFLLEKESGISELDFERISKLHGKVYRIEKAKPFNDKDLSTIQTTISKIK